MFSLIQTIQLPCHEHAQRKNLDLIEAANESRVVINVLQEERDDDIRAVYTRENKPRLTIAAAYIRREHPV